MHASPLFCFSFSQVSSDVLYYTACSSILFSCAPENLVSRDGFGNPVPRPLVVYRPRSDRHEYERSDPGPHGFIPVAWEFCLAKRFRQTRSASAICFFCTVRDWIDTGNSTHWTSDQISGARLLYQQFNVPVKKIRAIYPVLGDKIQSTLLIWETVSRSMPVVKLLSIATANTRVLWPVRVYEALSPAQATMLDPIQMGLSLAIRVLWFSIGAYQFVRLQETNVIQILPVCALAIEHQCCSIVCLQGTYMIQIVYSSPWAGPDRCYALLSKNEYQPSVIIEKHSSIPPFFSSANWGEPGRRGDHFRVRSRVELNLEALACYPRTSKERVRAPWNVFFLHRTASWTTRRPFLGQIQNGTEPWGTSLSPKDELAHPRAWNIFLPSFHFRFFCLVFFPFESHPSVQASHMPKPLYI